MRIYAIYKQSQNYAHLPEIKAQLALVKIKHSSKMSFFSKKPVMIFPSLLSQQYQDKLLEDYESLEWYNNYWDHVEQKNSTNSSLGYQTRFTEVRTRNNLLLESMKTLVSSTAVSHFEYCSARVLRYTVLTHCSVHTLISPEKRNVSNSKLYLTVRFFDKCFI